MGSLPEQTEWVVPPAVERSGATESNEWFALRSQVEVSDTANGLVRIAADSKYWLYVNGQVVVREGGLKRGPTPKGSYYDEVDVSTFLKPGINSFAILLCYFGRHGFSHRDSGVPGIWVDSDFMEFGEWKVKKNPAYFDAGYVHDAYRLSESSVGFDARYDLTGWTLPEFNDSDWSVAEPSGAAGTEPWGLLEKREFPQWFWSGLKEYEAVEKRETESGDGYTTFHCKLPHNAHFVPVLAVEACSGIRIDITVAQDTNRFCSSYITKEGSQQYEFPNWLNGEEVLYKVPSEEVQIIGLSYRETGYPSEFSGSFFCDEPQLNTLWEKARRTLYVTMRDTFMDCPCRERAQWPGDLVVQLGQVPYCLDRESDLLVKKGLRETLRWQREDGVIYGPVPEGNWRMELPAQMLAVISPYGIWTYYMNTADRDTLAELYPFAKRYLAIWEFQENGLIKYRPAEKGALPSMVDGVSAGSWDWIDWGERIDALPALNAWFVLAAQGVRKMAEELGLEKDVREIRQKESGVLSAIRKTFWDEAKGGYCSARFEYAPDDRVQALMVLCGAAEESKYPRLKKVFETVQQACPYMEKYVLEALIKMKEPYAAIERMKKRYRSLVENGNSTLWERWPEESDHPGTINHSWSGGPLTLLSEWVAGIRPLEPGWKKVLVRPLSCGLNEVQAKVRLPQGMLELSIAAGADGQILNISVPPHTEVLLDATRFGGPEPAWVGAGQREYRLSGNFQEELCSVE